MKSSHIATSGSLTKMIPNSVSHSTSSGANGLSLGSNSILSSTASAIQRRKPKRAELSEDQRLEIKEAFELFDSEKSGTIGFHELKVCLKAFGFPVKKNEINELRRTYDQKQTGRLDFNDFNEILTKKISERDPLDEVKKAFQLFDDDNTGKINLKNLRRVARELGETLSDDELQAMIDEFDLDNDGEISEAEFIAIMTQSAML